MFGFRICKRTRRSSVRMLLLTICLCMLFLLLNKIGNSNPVESIESIEFDDILTQETMASVFDAKSTMENYIVSRKDFTSNANRLKHIETKNDQPIVKLDKYGNSEDLRDIVKRLNNDQRIWNLRMFPKRSKDSIVIVVQVHKRSNYLTKLVNSLRNAKGISDALLVVSHDFYSSKINSIVRSIDFCQVMQIFFPYSEQLYPDQFPGSDPNDCPRDMPKARAHLLQCNNADHPDRYGHYREAKFTMTKHHWWWKANRVFNELRATKNHEGLVLFVEEDHYLAPDFYEVLIKAYLLKQSDARCVEYGCDIITLGDYKKVTNYVNVGSHLLRLQTWKSTENNMGMAIDRESWQKISKCSEMFCTYDDYNWDWTLMHVSLKCLLKPLTVLLFQAPRVFHLGTCGLHHQTANCDVETVLAEAVTVIDNNKHVLEPQSLEIEVARPWSQTQIGQPNGGWGDDRDHKLCLNFIKSTD